MNNKLTYALGFLTAALLLGVVSFSYADFVKNGDGSSTIAFKVSATDTTRIVTALKASPGLLHPSTYKDDADYIGQSCTLYLNSFTKGYEIQKAVDTARTNEEAKPGVTFNTSVSADAGPAVIA